MADLIDLDNLTPDQVEKLRKIVGVPLTEEQRYKQRQDEIGTRPGWIKITQINCGKRRYFCQTDEEEAIFAMNHPEEKTETFHIELPILTAETYLNDPENKKHFKEKGK